MCCCTGEEQPYIMCAEVTAGASTSSSLLVLSFEEKTEEVDGKKSILLLRQFFQLKISENFILRAANWFGASKKELGYSLDTQRCHHHMRLERKDEKRIKRCCSPQVTALVSTISFLADVCTFTDHKYFANIKMYFLTAKYSYFCTSDGICPHYLLFPLLTGVLFFSSSILTVHFLSSFALGNARID